ncbi:MAG: hypothetical protein V2A64_02275 [Candidatus Omnitrophota bacterium]
MRKIKYITSSSLYNRKVYNISPKPPPDLLRKSKRLGLRKSPTNRQYLPAGRQGKSSPKAIFLIVFTIFFSFILIVLMKQIFADETIIRPKVEYKAEVLKDPFRGFRKKGTDKKINPVYDSKAPVKPLPALTVQGIVWGGQTAQAIINNKVVKVGDTIENVEIIDITKNGIDVFFEDQEYNLPAPASSTQGLKKN